MTLPTRPRDGYLAALAAIAPNAARLKAAYAPNLGRALLIAVNVHLLALGAYWVATVALRADTAEAAPAPKYEWIPTKPHFPSTPPDLVPKPPSTGGGAPTQAAASGTVNLVDDAQVAPDATIATNEETSVSPSGPVTGTANPGDDGSDEPGSGTTAPQLPDPPVIDRTAPPVPQRTPEVVEAGPSNEIVTISEISPEIIGGLAGVQARVAYPRFDREVGNQGTVVVRFVVEPSGEPSSVEVARSVTPGLDAAAVAAVRQTRFTPGVQNGRTVRVRMTLPVRFTVR